MPRKKRDIRRDYRQAGFSERKGKGDHTIFAHPLLGEEASVDGRDGDDAHH
jgi:predicted RNA binding protein YcfA (HicA-like mRNA interferase family)